MDERQEETEREGCNAEDAPAQKVAERPDEASGLYAGDKPSVLSSLRKKCTEELHRHDEHRQCLRAGEVR